MRQKFRKIASLLLAVLFVSYYGECTLFIHTHIFPWGRVTHSHPFLPSSHGHSHSEAECQTLAALSNVVLAPSAGAVPVLAAVFLLTAVILAVPVHSLARHMLRHRTLRAPPVVIC